MLSDIVFRWVPASIASLTTAVQTAQPPVAPVSIWDVPALLSDAHVGTSYDVMLHAWMTFALCAFAAALPFIGIIVYSMVRVWQIRHLEKKEHEKAYRAAHDDPSKSKTRWNRITDHLDGDKPDSWRLAILEADIMLNELLDLKGYKGETMADKMKQIDRADFNSIDLAWEAHKYRNKVAHETADNALEYREVRRVIALYERVFREFGFIE